MQPDIEELEDDVEVKAQQVHIIQVTEEMRSALTIMEERISSWHRMIRVVAWVWRFINLLKNKDENVEVRVPSVGYDKVKSGQVRSLVVSEIQHAEVTILKWLQERSFESDIKIIKSKESRGLDKKEGQLWRLCPVMDEEGLIRVGGRLMHAEEPTKFRFPIIIPKHTISTKRLVEWQHKKIQHSRRHSTVAQIREAGYWVISCGKIAGAVVHACVRCRWLRGKLGEQMMADLPVDRTSTQPPFTYCGVDLFGAFKVKEGRKVMKQYGVILPWYNNTNF